MQSKNSKFDWLKAVEVQHEKRVLNFGRIRKDFMEIYQRTTSLQIKQFPFLTFPPNAKC